MVLIKQSFSSCCNGRHLESWKGSHVYSTSWTYLSSHQAMRQEHHEVGTSRGNLCHTSLQWAHEHNGCAYEHKGFFLSNEYIDKQSGLTARLATLLRALRSQLMEVRLGKFNHTGIFTTGSFNISSFLELNSGRQLLRQAILWHC